jgi:ligand-binding sensor domain-containing protein
MRFRILGALAVVLLIATSVSALDPERRFDQYVHRTWLAIDGLPQNSVTSIVQSADGYLWLGTWGGLARFDGISFETFDTGTSPAIRSSRIVTLAEDAEGRLWIGTERGGLVRYEDGHFSRVPLSDGVDLSVYCIVQGPKGTMWVGTDNGLFRFDRETSRRFGIDDGLPSNEVMSLLFPGSGDVLIGTTSGAARFDGSAVTLLPGPLASTPIRAILETSAGRVLLGGNEGLYALRDSLVTRLPLGASHAENEVITLFEDSDANVWAGRPGEGLLRIRGDEIEVIRRRDGISSDSIRTIFEDREKNLWIGTEGGGLMLARDGKAVSWGGPFSPLGRSVVPIVSDGEGGLWIGMACGGLGRLRADESIEVLTKSDGLHSDCIWSLMRDSRGLLWIGSSEDGVATWDGRRFSRVRDPVGRGLNVNVIFEDGRGRIWAGSNAGLLVYDEDSDEFLGVMGTESYHVSNIFEARDTTLWVATTRGILIFDGTIREVINAADGLANEFVRAIHEDEDGVFWIGTYGGGLHRIARGQISQFGVRDGLFDDIVSRIFETPQGDLWMSGNRGISRVNKADIEGYLGGRLDRIPGEIIGTYDGMINAECNGGGQPAGHRSSDGRMWFPTVDGIVMIDPARVRRNTLPPPVFIDSVRVGGGRVDLQDGIALPRGSRNLEIAYTALSYAAPERVRFRYRLQGLDPDWIEAGSRRVAYYPFIPPGDYTFTVIAANNDGVWNEEGASFTFSLTPRLYQRPWVWGLVILAVVALLLAAHRARLAHLERREEELGRIVANRTEELEVANKELKLLASSDSLTGVANHRRFREFLAQEWRRCMRESKPVGLAIADID